MRLTLPFAALALVVPAAVHAAEPSLASCGDIYVEAEAECTMYVGPACEAMCEPVHFTAACAAELRAECEGPCDASASVACVGSCAADCRAECEVDPGAFNCHATCQADCAADCQGRCAGDARGAECEASCKATCSGECDGRCQVVAPEATCEGKCEAACEGSCEAQANVDCQIDCQADGYADCKADLEGGCRVSCMRPEGALFCEGQYVDAGDNLQECVAALKALLDVMVYAEGDAGCVGNTCYAEGKVGCSCDAGGGPGDALAAAFGLVALGLVRRRPRTR